MNNFDKFENVLKIIQEKLLELNRENILIGISGIAGSGKSTFAKELNNKLTNFFVDNKNSAIIQFDGYHKYKKELTDEQIEFRGRIDTFDLHKFKKDLTELYEFIISEDKNSTIKKFYYPSFDHSVKDPIENDIIIQSNTNFIIVEGLYIFTKELDCNNLFDIKIFLETDVDKSMERVARRNYEAGISSTYEDSVKRTNKSDKINSIYVLNNSVIDSNTIKINYISI